MLPTTVLDSSDSLTMSFQSWEDPGFLGHPRILPWYPLRHNLPCCPEDSLDVLGSSLHVLRQSNLVLSVLGGSRIPRTSRDPPLVSPQTQAPMLCGGFLGHPGILSSCPLRHRPPCCPEDPLDIPGSSLGVPSNTGPHAVWRIPRTSRDPLFMSPQTQAPMLSGGSVGHPGILPWSPLRHRPPCCPEDPLDIPGSSLHVPSDTVPHAVRRIPWTSRDPPLVSPQTQAPMLCGGFLGHPGILSSCPLRHRPPCCPEDPLDIPGSSLGLPSDTVPHAVRRIPWTSRDPPFMSPQTQSPMLSGGFLGHPRTLPWCPLRHRPPCCPEDPLDIPGSSLHVQAPMLSRGSLGHLGILPSCPLKTQAPKLSGGSLRHPRIHSSCPLQTQAPKLSGGSLGHLMIPDLPTTPVQNS